MYVLVSDVCNTYVIVMCLAPCKLKSSFFAKFHSQPHNIISFKLLSKYKDSLAKERFLMQPYGD